MEYLKDINTIEDTYSKNDIKKFIDIIDNYSERRFTTADFKNSKMLDKELAQYIYDIILEKLPSNTYIDKNSQKWQIISPIQFVMFAAIKPTQSFPIHTDTGVCFDEVNKIYSKFTVLTYLNDDFEGGTTSFYTDDFKKV